jgi:hypothetical protein
MDKKQTVALGIIFLVGTGPCLGDDKKHIHVELRPEPIPAT